MSRAFKKFNWPLIIILILAGIVRFTGLTWCYPYTPHPDEWNMAMAITRLNWQDKLNPQFYAYGQFPLYLSYFSAQVYNFIPWIKIKVIDNQEAIFFLRFWSATAGIGTVYLVYLITKKVISYKLQATSYLPTFAALLAVFTPGLIQISHFGTTESILSFFFLLILLLSLKMLENNKTKEYIFLGITLGLAIGTKISAFAFGFPVFLVFIIKLANIFKNKNKLNNLGRLFLNNLVLLVLLALVAFISSPYLILAFKESRGTLLYETSLATGQSRVFYTRQFLETKPILFQLQKIFPYALGWPIFIFGTLGFFLMFFLSFSKKRKSPLITNRQSLIALFSFLIYFLSQAFLFTKWTRFQAPIFAFFPIFTACFLNFVFSRTKNHFISSYLYIFISSIAIIPGVIFSSIYFLPDIRFTASDWIFKNIPSGSKILHDTGNVVDIPIVQPNLPNFTNYPNYIRTSFDFYHLDENPKLITDLYSNLQNTDYIIIPSRRIFKNHMRFPDLYPQTTKYYEDLFSGKLGYKLIKEFGPFSFLGKFSVYFQDEEAEETFSVFDHPVIRIYKKLTI